MDRREYYFSKVPPEERFDAIFSDLGWIFEHHPYDVWRPMAKGWVYHARWPLEKMLNHSFWPSHPPAVQIFLLETYKQRDPQVVIPSHGAHADRNAPPTSTT